MIHHIQQIKISVTNDWGKQDRERIGICDDYKIISVQNL